MPSVRSESRSIPLSVQIGTGGGGLPVVRVSGRAGSAEVYLHGAHVTDWAPAGRVSALWMSAASRFVHGVPLRGGVPLCFPWFGALTGDPQAPAHGFARRVDWELDEAHEDGDDVVLTFRLTDTEATRASAWPHRFEARYTVTVGARLSLALQVTNLDPGTVTFEEAFHSYVRVKDIRAIELTGLEGAPYLDRLAGTEPLPGSLGPVRFGAETDRIYFHNRGTTTVVDRGAGRSVTIAKGGSDSTVVWTPWATTVAAMSDFGDDECTGMVCVESCNIRDDAIHLAPGESHTMSAVFGIDG